MLILSRASNQSIVFPNVGITVHVLALNGNRAKIGVEAPRDITVFRSELTPLLAHGFQFSGAPRENKADESAGLSPEALHRLNNQLNQISLGLQLCQSLLDSGYQEKASEALREVADHLSELDREWIKVDSSQTDNEPIESFIAEQPMQKGVRLLIVEDDDNQRVLLSGILSMKGCHCFQATNGEEAFELLQREERFDLAILDMHMPRMNGLETLRAIRQDERLRDMKVFSVSSTSPSDVGVLKGEHGFDGWLPKPLNPITLWNHIQAIGQRTDTVPS